MSPIKTLAEVTTSRVGGPAQNWVVTTTEEQLVDAIREADQENTPLLVVGGGSNLLVADEGFPGTVVQIGNTGIETLASSDDYVDLRVAAGEIWDAVVAYTVEQGLAGLEALSGIPGMAGATPVQNVGAYGSEVAETLIGIRALDRETGQIVTLMNDELGFGYRTSIIKRTLADSVTDPRSATPRWVVLSVDFRLNPSGQTAPVRYGQLARALNLELGDEAPLTVVREHVLKLRASKGMVLDPEDHDTWSTGSFFTNPIIPATAATHLPEDAPQFPAGSNADGQELVKLSAAWLIDHAGFHKAFGLPSGPENGQGDDGIGLAGGRASLSTKHTLSLTNRGEATTADMVLIARTVKAGVQEKWGITLEPEPVLIGTSV